MSAEGDVSEAEISQVDAPGKAEMLVGGRRFVVGCAPGQEDRLKELGRRFDARVQELIDAMGDLGAERLFLMASLTLMDEAEAQGPALDAGAGARAVEAARAEALAVGRVEGETEAAKAAGEKLAALERRAAAALADAATRVSALARRIEDFE
jgi:cell division protein ZapA